jgi:hypothetical protein
MSSIWCYDLSKVSMLYNTAARSDINFEVQH